ncbi:MAG: hypothetical protein ABL879_01320 [Devosia sp.]
MTLSGPDALRSMEDALRDIRREEDEIAKRLSHSADMIARIRQQEGEMLRKLASLRLDPAVQAQLTGELSGAERKAREMLKAHGESLSEVETALKGHDADIARLTAERAELQAEAAARDRALKALADKVRPELMKQADYTAALAGAQSLTAIADEATRKTEQAEADRESKGRPYRDDPLFMYLWERGFGTKNYRANNLVVMLDRWVARLIDFVDARPNFAMLNEIPMRLREHADRQEENARAAVSRVTALETAAIDAAGGAEARVAFAAATAKMAERDAEIVKLQDQRDEAAKTQRELAQGSDPAFASAIAALAEALGREDVQVLLSDARLTSTGQDDTIVKQIDDARQRATEEEADTREHKARLKTLSGRRRELEDIQFEFKKQGYDSPASSFGEDSLVSDALGEFLRGGITAAAYWDRWQKSQKWSSQRRPRDEDDDRDGDKKDPWRFDERFGGGGGNWGNVGWPENSIGGGSSTRRSKPFGGGGTFGGGFSRPRGGGGSIKIGGGGGGFKTGSGIGGGGFKTGGGF